MTPLRQKMIEYMILKGFAESTQTSYLAHIRYLAEFYNQNPAQLTEDDLRAYLLHCHVVKHWSFSSCRQFIHAARCLYDKVLKQPISKERLPLPPKEEKLPDLLSRVEVQKIINCCRNVKHQTALMMAYATGVRVSELVKIQVKDLDGERSTIRIRGGKGRKDRDVDFSAGLKQCLRDYWKTYHPKQWLFYSSTPIKGIGKSTVQRAYSRAKLKADIHKRGGIHALRHAFATHQLEAGMPLPRLQQLLGHAHISCTLRYTRWLSCTNDSHASAFDLLAPPQKTS
ncbi:tyrosine-type recombinase/integrase [Aliikangiella sp. IMCC44632]